MLRRDAVTQLLERNPQAFESKFKSSVCVTNEVNTFFSIEVDALFYNCEIINAGYDCNIE